MTPDDRLKEKATAEKNVKSESGKLPESVGAPSVHRFGHFVIPADARVKGFNEIK